MDDKLKGLLRDGASQLGLELTQKAVDDFLIYLRELKAWNRKMNLTSIDDDRGIVIRHFLDSFTAHALFKGAERLLDMGAGAGFPGIPLKILMPCLDVVLIDSVEKKVHFMRHVIRALGLKGIEAMSGRVEDPSMIKRIPPFDIVISRAFTELKNFIPLALPYLKAGGKIVAVKGPAYKEELKEAGLKGVIGPEVFEVAVPYEKRVNTLLVFTKV